MIMKKGMEVYFGQASGLVQYMESLNMKIDYRMNPSDFAML